jgi:tubulin polyglutamylase TTLL4
MQPRATTTTVYRGIADAAGGARGKKRAAVDALNENVDGNAGGAEAVSLLKVPRRPLSLRYKTYWMRNSVKQVFREAGFARCKEKDDGSWDVLWGKHLPPDAYRDLPLHKRLNSFPGTGCIGAKDRLATLLRKFQRRLRDRSFDFLPETHVLRGRPGDLDRFYADVQRANGSDKRHGCKGKRKGSSSSTKAAARDLWICKPQGGSCGRGIEVMRTKDVKKLPMKRKLKSGLVKPRVWNVQRYIHNPYLIDNRKFDVRCYVLVTSFNPLRVYMFNDGMVRLCTSEYSLDVNKLQDSYRHLTNYSINKTSDAFVENTEADDNDTGHKQSLSSFFKRLRREGKDVDRLAEKMRAVVCKTMIACESECYPKAVGMRGRDVCCFEVFGVDLMFDARLNVWLIEVNIYPSMMSASPFDKRLKCTMLSDTLHIVGVPPGLQGMPKKERPRDVLRETVEELERAKGTNFITIYPTRDAIQKHERCFESSKGANDVVKGWLFGRPAEPGRRFVGMDESEGEEDESEGEEDESEAGGGGVEEGESEGGEGGAEGGDGAGLVPLV